MILTIKLIIRNWWRNKMYFFISLFSLTIGLACTNLLITFFIHEYNIESTNPIRKNIYILRQDSPMGDDEKVTYTANNAAKLIQKNYAEIESMFRLNSMGASLFQYKGQQIAKAVFLQVDSTLLHFFDYTTKEGSLIEALTTPDKIALSEKYTRKVFGNKQPVGERIEVFNADGTKKTYQIAAVLKERSQSFLKFDMLTAIDNRFFGGPTLLKMQEGTDIQAFEQKLKDDKVPTLIPGQTSYYVDPIKEIYFAGSSNSKQQPMPYLHQANVQLLYIALFSALLVLVMACVNYSNLNLSRTLQQLKMIHIEKLMGAKLKEIRMQLFLDATLTVFISFLMALLLINDILPWFNDLLSVYLPYSFFFSWQVLPLLLGFVLLLSVIPGIYISYHLSRQSISEYRKHYTGKNRQHIVWALVSLQFMLSLALFYAATLAKDQMNLIKTQAFRYENTIELGDMMSGPNLYPLQQKLSNVEGIEAMTLSTNSVMNGWIMQIAIKQPNGSESIHSKSFIHTESSFFPTMGVHLLEGLSPDEAVEKYGSPFYINQNYARWTNTTAEDIGKKKLKDISQENPNAENILAGIIANIPTNSVDEQVHAQEITLYNSGSTYLSQKGKYLQIRLNSEKREAALEQIEALWKELYDGRHLIFVDMHQLFMERNRKVMQLSHVLNAYSCIALLLTCFGLFGISWYAVRQRTREIAIRKVHGASTWSIVWLLHRPFFVLIGIAYIIAMPIVWWLMQHWLEQFVYQAESSIGQFVLPLIVVGTISFITVSIHTLLASKNNPMESLKTE